MFVGSVGVVVVVVVVVDVVAVAVAVVVAVVAVLVESASNRQLGWHDSHRTGHLTPS